MVTLFENCSNSGNITSTGYAGGIVGDGDGKVYIKQCHNSGNMNNTGTSSGSYAGGIWAEGDYIYIEDSYNTGNITAVTSFGIGYRASYINRCYNTGVVTGKQYAVGIAFGATEISNSFNQGDIYGTIEETDSNNYTGYYSGIVYSINTNEKINNCSNYGNITATHKKRTGASIYVEGIAYSSVGTISNCSNLGNINVIKTSEENCSAAISGIVYSGNPINCYNSGNLNIDVISGSGSQISGIATYNNNNGSIQESYNTGNISFRAQKCQNETKIGGISTSAGNIIRCYNTGNIINNIEEIGTSNYYIGGIKVGSVTSLVYSYNTGDIISNISNGSGNVYVGGINASSDSSYNQFGKIYNVYNIGSVYNNAPNSYVSAILANPNDTRQIAVPTYYKNDIDIVGKNIINNSRPCSEEYMKSEEFYKTISSNYTDKKWIHYPNQYPTLDISIVNDNNKIVELTVKNTKKQYDITTQIEANSNGEYTGGTITGEESKYGSGAGDRKLVETVKHGDTSTKDIIITPDTNNHYIIKSIAINDEQLAFEPESDGSYKIPAGYFKNMDKAYNIKVSFIDTSESGILNINKTDENNNKISGAKFEITSDSISENNLIGELTANGDLYFKQGTLPGESWQTYYCTSDEFITPINRGMYGTFAHSYCKLDLTDETEDVYVMAKAYEGRGGALYGYISENTEEREGVVTDGFLFASNSSSEQAYLSEPLAPGKVYYIHFGYCGSSSGDEIYINISGLKAVHASDIEFEMQNLGENILEKTENGYEMINSTTTRTSNSYIPVDLEGKTGKYKVSLTAELSDSSTTVMITEDEEVPQYDSNKVILSTYGTKKATGISNYIEGGKKYYIHIAFYPYSNATAPRVVFSNIKLIEDINKLVVETDENGKAMVDVPEGTYTVKEVKAPDGYIIDDTAQTVSISANQNRTLDFINQKKQEVVIHYYEKETGEAYNNEAIEIKPDEHIYGKQGEKYNTTDNLSLQIGKYSLAVNDKNEYVIPENSTGEYGNEVIDVYYYYETKDEEKTNLMIKKTWNTMENANDYRAKIKVYSIVGGRKTPLIDEFGDDLVVTIQGNGAEYIPNLPRYENNETIEYKIEEFKIEKRTGTNYETQEDIWEEIPLEQFKGNYKVQ